MCRLSRFPILKTTSLKIILTNYFQSWTKLLFAYINIATLLVETLFNKLLNCVILTFREIPKPGDLYLKLSNRSEISQTEQQHNSGFSCPITERSGYFNIKYSGFDTSRELMLIVSKPLLLRRAERKNGSRTHSADPPRHRTAIVETHNMKTLKPKNPLRPAATAPRWCGG